MSLNEQFKQEFALLLEVPAEDVLDDFNISKHAAWDSLTFLGTISLIDKYFNIIVDGSLLVNISTYGDLCELIRKAT